MNGSEAYRRDIDGLRAIAVLAVILYHLDFGFAGSGFAGVDVFFVISGFLIGGIILRERAEGRFSYRAFYARRARRILPALIAMMAVTVPIAWQIMTPDQLRYFAGGLFSTLIFLSNIWFYYRVDYFNPDAGLDPLLHTWSLAIEEQFYITLPIVILLLWRFGPRVLAMVFVGLAVLSFGLAVGYSERLSSQTFYFPHFRAWELLAGVLVAMGQPLVRRASLHVQAQLANLGLMMVIVGVTILPIERGWPNALCLVPVLGTALVLLTGGGPSMAQRLLSLAPMRGIGLVSYSAYLIHHPMISLPQLAGYSTEGVPFRLLILILCFALAWASWRYIEQPFRKKGALVPRRKHLLNAGIVCLFAFALGGHLTKGYPQRLPQEAQDVLAYENSRSPTHDRCTLGRTEATALDPDKACVFGNKAAPIKAVIWGDSHVTVLTHQLGEALPHLALTEFSLGGCPPIPGIKNILAQTNAAIRMSEACSQYNQILLDYVLEHEDIRLIVLYAYWNNYVEKRDFDIQTGFVRRDKLFSVPVEGDASVDEETRQKILQKRFSGLVQALLADGRQVLIIYPLPEAAFDLPQYVARRIWKDGVIPERITYPTQAFADYSAQSRALLDSVGDLPGLFRLDVSDAFCAAGDCVLFEAGVPYFFDTNHLSQPGVKRMVPRIAEKISTILSLPVDATP